jgi:hypothetical protein
VGADGSLFGVAMREEEAAREMNEQFVEFGRGGRAAEAGGDLGEDFAEGGGAGPCAEVDGLGNLPEVADGGVNEGFELREGDGEEQGPTRRKSPGWVRWRRGATGRDWSRR